MATKTPRTFQARIESLEHREVLSTVALGHHVLALRGNGTGAVASVQNLPGGGFQTVTNLDGRANALGHFGGQVLSTFAGNGSTTNDSAVLVAQNGDQLNLFYSGGYRAPRGHSTRAQGTFHFTVTGGTGRFASATGGGTLVATIDTNSGASTFRINGRVSQ